LESEYDEGGIPPIVINNYSLRASDITSQTITQDKVPDIYSIIPTEKLSNVHSEGQPFKGQINTDKWTYRKEANIRDKFVKIRIRYSGKDPVIISGIITAYNTSAT